MLNLAQLLRAPHVDSGLRFDISPDKQNFIFSWNQSGQWDLYEADLEKSASDSPRLVSQRRGAKFAPRYSPDGNFVAYACDNNGSESYHIIFYDLQNKIDFDLTPSSDYAQQPNFDFSPDGNSLAILSDECGQFGLYLIRIKDKKRELLLDVHYPIWDVTWSPNGKHIAVEAESTASDRTIYIFNTKTKDATQIKCDGEVLNAEHPAWSPDSKFLAFSGESGEWHDIGLFEIASQKITWVHSSFGDDSQPTWSVDGKRIGWIHAEGAATSFQFRDGSEDIKQIQIGCGIHSFPKFTSESVILLYEDVRHPPDIWEINLEDRKPRQRTNSFPNDLRVDEFVQPEEVWYEGKDKKPIPALLYKPTDASAKSPAVINIHGGPNWSFQYLWHPVMSHMASRGWTVLAPNYRGSTGYGKSWQNASRYDFGGVDNDDCAAGMQYLIENHLADKNKIAVTGRSHGGYLTMTCLTTYPNLFAAGSAVVPFLNWIKSHYESREDLQHWNIENMGDPEVNHELWKARSPYFFLDRIKAPVQMICGANDPRCPASESLDARDKLLELGKPVDLLLYEDEGHSFLNIENVVDSEIKRIEFLAEILER